MEYVVPGVSPKWMAIKNVFFNPPLIFVFIIGPSSPMWNAEVYSDIPTVPPTNVTNDAMSKPSSKSASGRRSHSKAIAAATVAQKPEVEATENGWTADMAELSEEVRERLSFNGNAENGSKQDGGAYKLYIVYFAILNEMPS